MANTKLEKLLSIASSASVLALIFYLKVRRFVDTYNFYENQHLNIIDEIQDFINSASFADNLTTIFLYFVPLKVLDLLVPSLF